ncbi:MAG: DUF5696 domain-containing protein [Candidatus Zipacnadales bacterium]
MITCLGGLFVVTILEAQPIDPDFGPVLADMKLSADMIRPGDRFAIAFAFRNNGTAPAKRPYTVFLHFEQPEPRCDNIRFSAHYRPRVETVRWQPGETVTVGPYAVQVPEDASGEYYIHVGIYDEGGTGQRLCEEYRGKLTVDSHAPPHRPHRSPLSGNEAIARQTAMARRIPNPVTLDCGTFELHVSANTGTWQIQDKRTRELWSSDPLGEGFGDITLRSDERTVVVLLDTVEELQTAPGAMVLTYLVKPLPEEEVKVRVKLDRVAGPDGLQVTYEVADHDDWRAAGATLLRNALTVTNNEGGYLVVPHRLGILLRADGGLPDSHSFRAYANANAYSMAFVGAVKNGSAILVTWENAYTTLETHGTWVDDHLVPGSHMWSVSLRLTHSANRFTLYPLGKGEYVEIARAYRDIARKRGFLRTWREKIAAYAGAERMLGAVDFKPFVLSRVAPKTRWNNSEQERVTLSYTFDEAAQCAEHLRNEVGIERAMFVLAGWIHRGYDNQHPDILPAAPECGGNEGLAKCAERVKACGYLFGLHDNYQDMYRDAPSWDESFIMKRPDGSLHAGGVWAGGQAYLTCSRKALELAKRPQNLNEVRRLFHPTVYFIDTTFAAPPYECHDLAHPLSFKDDIYWKRELSRYARATFGLFGSEEGQEWAVPDADYFEGIMSHKVAHSGQDVVPLFEMVYGDCINLYTHQGDRATPERPKYILDHILYAENALYQFGPHLYFASTPPFSVPAKPEIAAVKQISPRSLDITYRWHVSGPMPQLDWVFVHFTAQSSTHPEKIVFQDDHAIPTPTENWQPGSTITIGPHRVEIPEGQTGEFEVLIGMLNKARERQALQGLAGTNARYRIGTIKLEKNRISFEPFDPTMPDTSQPFVRADNGYGRDLHPTDRFIRNTYEVLSPLNQLTAHTPMTAHEFLSADPHVERSEFGEVEIIVNYGPHPYALQGVELPQWGFIVRSPTFVAFHATKFGALTYSPSAMFVLQSLDGKPIVESNRVRVYHAFGAPQLRIGGKEFTIERVAELSMRE